MNMKIEINAPIEFDGDEFEVFYKGIRLEETSKEMSYIHECVFYISHFIKNAGNTVTQHLRGIVIQNRPPLDRKALETDKE